MAEVSRRAPVVTVATRGSVFRAAWSAGAIVGAALDVDEPVAALPVSGAPPAVGPVAATPAAMAPAAAAAASAVGSCAPLAGVGSGVDSGRASGAGSAPPKNAANIAAKTASIPAGAVPAMGDPATCGTPEA